MNAFGIADIAEEFGLTLRTLRFYEARGLIRPQRVGLARVYTDADRERIREIISLTKLGFTLGEIRTGEFTQAKFAAQLALLRQQREDLDVAIAILEEKAAGGDSSS